MDQSEHENGEQKQQGIACKMRLMTYRPMGICGEGVSRQYHDRYPTGDTFHVSLFEQVSLKTSSV